MKVQDIMSTNILTVSPKTPFRDLWKAIVKKRVHALPVIDKNKKLVGIVAEEDLLKPLYPNHQQFIEEFLSVSDFEDMEKKIYELVKLKAEHVMCKKVIFTRRDTPILRALSRMIVRNVRQLPVLSEEGVVIAMVSKGDIFDNLFNRHLAKKAFRHLKITFQPGKTPKLSRK